MEISRIEIGEVVGTIPPIGNTALLDIGCIPDRIWEQYPGSGWFLPQISPVECSIGGSFNNMISRVMVLAMIHNVNHLTIPKPRFK